MIRKSGISLLAVIMAVAFSAFTAPQSPAASDNTDLYWYQVDLGSQKVLQGSTYIAFSPDVSGCPTAGSDIDCKRGYEFELNTSAGDVDIPTDHRKMTVNQ